jgi:hypothetical protein
MDAAAVAVVAEVEAELFRQASGALAEAVEGQQLSQLRSFLLLQDRRMTSQLETLALEVTVELAEAKVPMVTLVETLRSLSLQERL